MMARNKNEFAPLLSKEEKEALLDKKIANMRRMNEQKEKRFQEVQADKQAFETTVSKEVTSPPSATQKQPHPNGVSGVKTRLGTGRGKRLENMSKQKLQATEYEAKTNHKEPIPGLGPPPEPAFSFLQDPSRSGPLPAEPQKVPEQRYKRHPRNFGGDTEFEAIPSKVKQEKERQGRQRPLVTEQDKELEMTGRERRKYNEWKTERQKIDDDRIARHRKSTWARDWDSNKTEQVFKETPVPPESQHTEPGRRPAGRIGSGRFDRSVVDEPKPVQGSANNLAPQKERRETVSAGNSGRTGQATQWSPRRRPLSRDFDDEMDHSRKRMSVPGSGERSPVKGRLSSRLSFREDGGRSVEEHNDSLIVNVCMDSRAGFVSRSDGQRTPEADDKDTRSVARVSGGGSPRKQQLRRPDRGGRLQSRDPAEHEDATNWRKTTAKGVRFEDWSFVDASEEKPGRATFKGKVDARKEEPKPRVEPGDAKPQDADTWAERKTKAAHERTQRRRHRNTNDDSISSDVHNSSAESLERFIEENTLHLDLHMDLPSLFPQGGGSQEEDEGHDFPENLIKTPVGFEHVLDWSTVTPEDDLDVTEIVYGKRASMEKPGCRSVRQTHVTEEQATDDYTGRERKEGTGRTYSKIPDSNSHKGPFREDGIRSVEERNDSLIINVCMDSRRKTETDNVEVVQTERLATDDTPGADYQNKDIVAGVTSRCDMSTSRENDNVDRGHVAAPSDAREDEESVVTEDVATEGLTVVSDTKVKAVASDTKVEAVVSDTKVEAVVSDTKVEAVVLDTKVEAVVSDTNVEAVVSDTKVEAVVSDTNVEAVVSDTKVEAVVSDTKVVVSDRKVEVVVSDTKVETVVSDTKVEAVVSDPKVETVVSDTKVEAVVSDPKVEAVVSDMKVEAVVSDTKVEAVVSETKVEAVVSDTKVEAVVSDTKVEAVVSDTKVEAVVSDTKVEAVVSDTKVEAVVSDTKVEAVVPDTKVEAVVSDTKAVVSDTKVEAVVSDTKVEAVVSDTKVEAVVSDTKVEAVVSDTKVEALVSDTKVEAVVPDTKVEAVVSDTNVEAVVSDTKVEAVVSDTKVEAVVPDTKVEAVVPDTKVEAVVSDTKVEAVVPDTKVEAVVSDTNVEAVVSAMKAVVSNMKAVVSDTKVEAVVSDKTEM